MTISDVEECLADLLRAEVGAGGVRLAQQHRKTSLVVSLETHEDGIHELETTASKYGKKGKLRQAEMAKLTNY